MHETPDDLAALQALLDRSYEGAGQHLRRIISPQRRLTAEQVSERLTGMCLLALATVTADGRPIVGPVDGVFFRGFLHFGSSPDSVRFRHIRKRPQVSATHLPGEHLAVTAHGRAVTLDILSDEHEELRQAYREVYGPDWGDLAEQGALYARIEAERMFTFHME